MYWACTVLEPRHISSFRLPGTSIRAAGCLCSPVGEPVRQALRNLKRGGRLIINAIRKVTPIPELDYAEHLWHEKELKSVANVTRRDAREFLPLAAQIPVVPETQEFRLEEANDALRLIKEGRVRGAAVLRIT